MRLFIFGAAALAAHLAYSMHVSADDDFKNPASSQKKFEMQNLASSQVLLNKTTLREESTASKYHKEELAINRLNSINYDRTIQHSSLYTLASVEKNDQGKQ